MVNEAEKGAKTVVVGNVSARQRELLLPVVQEMLRTEGQYRQQAQAFDRMMSLIYPAWAKDNEFNAATGEILKRA